MTIGQMILFLIAEYIICGIIIGVAFRYKHGESWAACAFIGIFWFGLVPQLFRRD